MSNHPSLCSCCRLPITVNGGFFNANEDGVFFVAAYCLRCRMRFSRLPTKSIQRSINIAARRVVTKPDKPWVVKFFAFEVEARIARALLCDSDTSDEARRAFFDRIVTRQTNNIL